MRLRSVAWCLAWAGIATGLVALLFVPLFELERTTSPDGAFSAVMHVQPIEQFATRMPGGGGDIRVRVTIYQDRRACGSAWVPLAWMAREVVWDLDRLPRRARIKLVAEWNLDDCSVLLLQ